MAGSNDRTSNTNGSQRKDKKKKGREVEALTQMLKTLDPEEQISTLLSKYAEMAEENKQFQATISAQEKLIQQTQKEKDKVDQDYTKAVLSRSKLESLCRELQRQMKTLKDENVLRLKEEEEKRREISNQFNTTLNEITRLMEENTQKNNKLREENNNMADRLKALIDHNDKREDHIDKVIKQKEIENQLSLAKMAKYQYEFTEQKGLMLTEKKTLLEQISSYQSKLTQMSNNEIALRGQLSSYSEKYEEFQSTLDKSNKLFKSFKSEMDEMSKSIKRHEKETKNWREKWDNANKALLQMVAERSQMESKLEAQSRQNTRLQSLCRALQQQLTEVRDQLKGMGEQSTVDKECSAALTDMSLNINRCDPCPLDYKSDQFDTASEDENLEFKQTSTQNNKDNDVTCPLQSSEEKVTEKSDSKCNGDEKLDMEAVD